MAEETIANIVRDVMGDLPQREVADRCGLNQTTIHNLLRNKGGTRATLLKFAQGMELSAAQTARLLFAAGLVPEGMTLREMSEPAELAAELLEAAEHEPAELTYDPDLDQLSVKGFKGAEGLSERDLETIDRAMRMLIQQKRKHLGHQIEGGAGSPPDSF